MSAPAAVDVTVRYWAGARAAAGVDEESLPGTTVAAVLDAAVTAHPALAPVLEVASVLVDGVVAEPARTLAPGETLEVLPPFAGG
ncbi:MoaD/ThiS family protein [Luteipulveratus halotolerans]|uniref:MoaD/ThiS family protein n=1 Tax=Luteipulveratus halotolerans TaxID=1631356 RepID=UPI001E3DCAA4|nr:MoaD/ThiS family protein [Luteipulveratus halotolerans]